MIDFGRVTYATERWGAEHFADYGLEGITPTQARALMVLVHGRASLTARELADQLGVSQVTVSRFVKALMAGGWLERVRDTRDRRAWRLHPTARTMAALPAFIAVTNDVMDRLFAGLTEAQFDALAETVAHLRRNAVAVDEAREP